MVGLSLLPSLGTLVPLVAVAVTAANIPIMVIDFVFQPNTTTAEADDIVQFIFRGGTGHSVVLADPDNPCHMSAAAGGGFWSGVVAEHNVSFYVTINDSSPFLFYSSNGDDCQSGMAGAVNPPNQEYLQDYVARAESERGSESPPGSAYGGVVMLPLAADESSSDAPSSPPKSTPQSTPASAASSSPGDDATTSEVTSFRTSGSYSPPGGWSTSTGGYSYSSSSATGPDAATGTAASATPTRSIPAVNQSTHGLAASIGACVAAFVLAFCML